MSRPTSNRSQRLRLAAEANSSRVLETFFNRIDGRFCICIVERGLCGELLILGKISNFPRASLKGRLFSRFLGSCSPLRTSVAESNQCHSRLKTRGSPLAVTVPILHCASLKRVAAHRVEHLVGVGLVDNPFAFARYVHRIRGQGIFQAALTASRTGTACSSIIISTPEDFANSLITLATPPRVASRRAAAGEHRRNQSVKRSAVTDYRCVKSGSFAPISRQYRDLLDRSPQRRLQDVHAASGQDRFE